MHGRKVPACARRKALRTKATEDHGGTTRSFLQIGVIILVVLAAAVAVLRRRTANARKSGYALL